MGLHFIYFFFSFSLSFLFFLFINLFIISKFCSVLFLSFPRCYELISLLTASPHSLKHTQGLISERRDLILFPAWHSISLPFFLGGGRGVPWFHDVFHSLIFHLLRPHFSAFSTKFSHHSLHNFLFLVLSYSPKDRWRFNTKVRPWRHHRFYYELWDNHERSEIQFIYEGKKKYMPCVLIITSNIRKITKADSSNFVAVALYIFFWFWNEIICEPDGFFRTQMASRAAVYHIIRSPVRVFAYLVDLL